MSDLKEPTKSTIPTMYEEIEQDEDVPRGYVKVIQLITYKIEGKKRNEFNELVPNKVGKGVYFCQHEEDKDEFVAQNPKMEIESYTIQLKKKTAIEKIDNPDNVKAFRKWTN